MKNRNDKNSGDLDNEKIRFNEVLLIGPNGEQFGKVSRFQALKKAEELDLDLLCVAPNANPPVCKLLNYGKYRFEAKRELKRLKRIKKLLKLKRFN